MAVPNITGNNCRVLNVAKIRTIKILFAFVVARMVVYQRNEWRIPFASDEFFCHLISSGIFDGKFVFRMPVFIIGGGVVSPTGNSKF